MVQAFGSSVSTGTMVFFLLFPITHLLLLVCYRPEQSDWVEKISVRVDHTDSYS